MPSVNISLGANVEIPVFRVKNIVSEITDQPEKTYWIQMRVESGNKFNRIGPTSDGLRLILCLYEA